MGSSRPQSAQGVSLDVMLAPEGQGLSPNIRPPVVRRQWFETRTSKQQGILVKKWLDGRKVLLKLLERNNSPRKNQIIRDSIAQIELSLDVCLGVGTWETNTGQAADESCVGVTPDNPTISDPAEQAAFIAAGDGDDGEFEEVNIDDEEFVDVEPETAPEQGDYEVVPHAADELRADDAAYDTLPELYDRNGPQERKKARQKVTDDDSANKHGRTALGIRGILGRWLK